VDRYEATAGRFLEGHEVSSDGRLALSGADVNRFLLAEFSRLAVGSAKGRVAELRSLLRFLYLKGVIASPLADAVPPVAGWRGTALPPTPGPGEVDAILASCDRTTATGRRDFAITLVIARLGLRAAEVAAMSLDDLDWRAGEVLVHGKGRREDRLPLPTDVGEALVEHLRGRRRQPQCRLVFVTRHAPVQAMHPVTVSGVVRNASERAGMRPPVAAHRLRHALASELLRQGASLVEIGQVLRQRDLATTSVYAKVDLARLRQVARTWPGAAR
jgi:site-specific recombinase XerD